MKKTISIVGAGQAGLQLGIGLLQNNYQVTFVTDKTEAEIANGFATSSQGMFDIALQHEATLGLNFWDDAAPKNETVTFSIINPQTGKAEIYWQGYVQGKFQSVDQRVKFPRWMQEAKKLGGSFIYQKADIDLLEQLATEHNLVIVASGKGEIGQIFQTNYSSSKYDKPQRALSMLYVNNITPYKHGGVRAHIIPGIGEYFIMPGLGVNGRCEMMLFEGLFGGPFDCWADINSPQEQLNKALELLQKYIPSEAERVKNAVLADPKGVLKGSYTPCVKNPIARLPSGKKVFGMADAVLLNDPAGGQGSNNASKCAMIYLSAIIAQGEKEFNEQFMQKTFNHYWNEVGSWATHWTNLLLEPPQEHMITLLQAASHDQLIADYLANAFNEPRVLFPWIVQPTLTQQFIDKISHQKIEQRNVV